MIVLLKSRNKKFLELGIGRVVGESRPCTFQNIKPIELRACLLMLRNNLRAISVNIYPGVGASSVVVASLSNVLSILMKISIGTQIAKPAKY